MGQYSIRINDQWPICFERPEGEPAPFNIEIVVYHRRSAAMARPSIHPGEILADEIAELGVSAARLGRDLHVPTNRITQILNCSRAIRADTALELEQWLRSGPEL